MSKNLKKRPRNQKDKNGKCADFADRKETPPPDSARNVPDTLVLWNAYACMYATLWKVLWCVQYLMKGTLVHGLF